LREKFESACNELRKDEEIEDRKVQFAIMEGDIPKVNGEQYSGEELIPLPNVAIYQGRVRAAWLLDPVACIGNPPERLSNGTQVAEFLVQRLMPYVNPKRLQDRLDEQKPDVVVTAHILEPHILRYVNPIQPLYLEAFHGVMLHSWYQGSNGAKYAFVLREAELEHENGQRQPKVTMSSVGQTHDDDSGSPMKMSEALKKDDMTSVTPFVDFGNSNLYFALLQWVQRNALPVAQPLIRCTLHKMLEKPGIFLIGINLPLSEVIEDTKETGWRIFYTNKYTPDEVFTRYAIDVAERETFRGIAMEKIEEDTGLYGRRKASSKYKLKCDRAREAIELYEHWMLDRLFRSEPIPDKTDDDVMQLVGATMNQFIFRTCDVVMLFCAPWCGHCKEFDKQYNALAHVMRKTRPWVRFARMDSTQNDNRFFDFSTSPQVFFFPRKASEPIHFDHHKREGFEGFNEWVYSLTGIEGDENMGTNIEL